MKPRIVALIAVLALAVSSQNVEAGLGQFIRKGAEYLGKHARKGMTEGAEAGARQVGSVADDLVGKAAGKVITAGGEEAGEQGAVRAGKAVAVLGMSSADNVLAHLGPAGIQSMGKLSPLGASMLAEVSAELAESPHKTEWLRRIGESGDVVATFLWNRKGSCRLLLQRRPSFWPDVISCNSEDVVTSTISAAGKHAVEPLITPTVRHVAQPIATEVTKQAAANFPWTLAWCLMFAGVAGGLVYWRLMLNRT